MLDVTHDDAAPLVCGTYAGWNRHMRLGEPACDECRAAQALYVRHWRARGGMASTRTVNRARFRAMTRLARMHPTEYRALYLEEKYLEEKAHLTDDEPEAEA